MSSAPSLILPPDGARPATYDHRQSAIALSNTATEAVRLALSNSEISSKDADEDERRDSFNDGSSDIDCVSTSDATAIGADTQASSDRSPHFYMHQGKDNERIDPLAIQSRGKGSVFGSFVATQGEPRRRASLMYMPDNALRNLQVETIIKQRRMEISLTKLVQFDPQRRKAKDNLARYFQRWAMALPLYQKCDELGLQLRERNRALQSIREAYVKDVLRYSYGPAYIHINNLQPIVLYCIALIKCIEFMYGSNAVAQPLSETNDCFPVFRSMQC
jgi:hypothetical protein